MKKILVLFGLTLATVTLSAQERLDFTQPDPVSATPVRSNKLFRFALVFFLFHVPWVCFFLLPIAFFCRFRVLQLLRCFL